jgi:hypothetical protein
LRTVLVGVVQGVVLQVGGATTNTDGLTLVREDLVDDLRYRHALRR